jgi:hypothetical protein
MNSRPKQSCNPDFPGLSRDSFHFSGEITDPSHVSRHSQARKVGDLVPLSVPTPFVIPADMISKHTGVLDDLPV